MMLTRLAFWLKTLAALSLCFWMAFYLSITMAGSAAVTIAVLSDPDSGAVFSKSKWRLIGTVLGGTAFLMLALAFIQSPWLMYLGLAIWLGLCNYASYNFRYFQAYAAVLAGFTATIVLADLTSTQASVALTVLERISEVSLGVMSVALIFGLTHIRQGVKRLEPEMHLQARRILDVAKGIIANPSAQTQVTLIRQWVRQTDALQRSLLMLAEEEAVYAKQGLGIRLALTDLFSPLAKFSEDFLALAMAQDSSVVIKAREAVLKCLDFVTDNNNTQAVRVALENQIPQVRELLAQAGSEIPDVTQRAKVHAIADSLKDLLQSMFAYRSERQNPNSYKIRSYGKIFERKVVMIDSLFVPVGYLFIVWFWTQTYWPSGTMSLVVYSLVCLTQLSNDRPLQAALDFGKGFLLALPVSAFLEFYLLPIGEGFVWLMICFGLALIPGCWFRAAPKTAILGSGYLVFLMILNGTSNEMHYDFQGFLDKVVAVGLGIAVALISISIFHSWRGEKRLNQIMQYAIDDFEHAIGAVTNGDAMRMRHWEDRQFARIRQLDHIAKLQQPGHADNAAKRLLGMTDTVRRFRHEMAQTGQSDNFGLQPVTNTHARWTPWQHTKNFETIANEVASMAIKFRDQNKLERAEAWQAISNQLSQLERRLYV
jgi:uncharacterized membrane protein YccC